MTDVEELRVLARADSPRGEVVLRRRLLTGAREVDELIVNGTFAMDSAETSTERALARTLPRPGAEVLVGGLGLGFTAAELLRLGAGRVEVVEIEGCLVSWARAGVTGTLAAVATDPRVRLTVADIADVLRAEDDRRWDAIVLDVDNGPDFLIHEANARVYSAELLAAAADRLRPGGVLAVWCQGPAPALALTLAGLGGAVREELTEVVRQGRQFTYAIYILTR